MPSRPRITTRLTRLFAIAFSRNSVRVTSRMGQVMNVRSAEPIATKNGKERTGQGEPRTGPDVGVSRCGNEQQEKGRKQPHSEELAHRSHFFSGFGFSSSSIVGPGVSFLPTSPG